MCARRYRDLRRDMELISGALRAIPPDLVGNRWRIGSRVVAGGLAAAVAIFAAGWFTRSQMPVRVAQTSVAIHPIAARSESQVLASRHVRNAANQDFEHGAPIPVSYLTYLRDAFTDEDSCAQDDAVFNPSCSQDSRSE